MPNTQIFTALVAVFFLLSAVGCATAPKPLAQKEKTVDLPSDEVKRDRKVLAEEKGWAIRQFDLNRDDIADVFKFYGPSATDEGEVMLRKEIDLNHDGTIDVVQLFDPSGAKTQEHTDLDFDGRTDEVTHFNEGVVTLREIDLNYDGRTDVSKKYTQGTLVLIESDRTGDGKVDTWEYFENGAVARIGTDKDADGIVDNWEQKQVAAPAAPSPAPAATPDGAPSGEDAPAEETQAPQNDTVPS